MPPGCNEAATLLETAHAIRSRYRDVGTARRKAAFPGLAGHDILKFPGASERKPLMSTTPYRILVLTGDHMAHDPTKRGGGYNPD